MANLKLLTILSLLSGVNLELNKTEMDTTEIPSMCLITVRTKEGLARCGGSYVASNWILTTSHCFKDMFPMKNHKPTLEVRICMGTKGADWDKCDFPRSPSGILPYSEGNWTANDISLVFISNPYRLSTKIKMASLPRSRLKNKQQLVNYRCMTAGWNLVDGNQTDGNLHKSLLRLNVDRNNCTDFENQICAEILSGFNRRGESGDPLICSDTLIGLLTIEDKPSNASYFVLTQPYLHWIIQHIGPAENEDEETQLSSSTIALTHNLYLLFTAIFLLK